MQFGLIDTHHLSFGDHFLKGLVCNLLSYFYMVQAEWMAPEVLRNEPSDEKYVPINVSGYILPQFFFFGYICLFPYWYAFSLSCPTCSFSCVVFMTQKVCHVHI